MFAHSSNLAISGGNFTQVATQGARGAKDLNQANTIHSKIEKMQESIYCTVLHRLLLSTILENVFLLQNATKTRALWSSIG